MPFASPPPKVRPGAEHEEFTLSEVEGLLVAAVVVVLVIHKLATAREAKNVTVK